MTTSTRIHERPMQNHLQPSLVIEYFLRNREDMWKQIQHEQHLNWLIVRMLVHSAIAFACYGAVIGLSSSILQSVTSAIKLPILFLLTLAICLPTLYLFNLFYGGKLSVQQTVSLVLSAITITSTLMLAFTPVTFFFLFAVPDYTFFVLLNTAILALSGVAGVGFLVDGMQRMNMLAHHEMQPLESASLSAEKGEMRQPEVYEEDWIREFKEKSLQKKAIEPPREAQVQERTINMSLLYVWLGLYGFIGTQLAWTLRPFFGSPYGTFQLFRALEGNFYIAVLQMLL